VRCLDLSSSFLSFCAPLLFPCAQASQLSQFPRFEGSLIHRVHFIRSLLMFRKRTVSSLESNASLKGGFRASLDQDSMEFPTNSPMITGHSAVNALEGYRIRALFRNRYFQITSTMQFPSQASNQTTKQKLAENSQQIPQTQ
jgi:hypothetical protein